MKSMSDKSLHCDECKKEIMLFDDVMFELSVTSGVIFLMVNVAESVNAPPKPILQKK